MAGHHHRSSFKNGHKTYKSKHASKGSLKRMYKGKVEKDIAGNKALKGESKLQRRNKSKQLRQQKIIASMLERKLFDGPHGAPKICTVIPLTVDVDVNHAVQHLFSAAVDFKFEEITGPCVRNCHVKQFKSNLKVVVPDMTNFLEVLDASKVADNVVFVLSGTSEVDPEYGEQIIRALELQGISSYVGVVSNLSKVHPKEKFQLDVKQSLESYFKHFFPNEGRVYNLEKPSDSMNVLRTLCQRIPRPVNWRDSRGYLVADTVDYADVDEEFCELMVEGIVRGVGLNSNRLVHIPNLGDFQISKMERMKASAQGKAMANKKRGKDEDLFDLTEQNYFESDANRDTLEEFAPGDIDVDLYEDGVDHDFHYKDLNAARFDDHGYLPRQLEAERAFKVPKGTSDYQAKWYIDDVITPNDDEEFEEMSDEETAEMEIDEGLPISTDPMDSGMDEEDGEEQDEMYVDLSPEEEERQLQEYRALEDEDREFPDEIELNPSESAIERLKMYRGLKNLYNCMWDIDEVDPNCPEEWRRLLRFGSYKNTRNSLLKEVSREAQVIAGDYVKVYLKFPKRLLPQILAPQEHIFALYGLLPHEHKNALVNFTLQRWEEYKNPVPSQEPIMVQYGVRRYVINPLFSADTNTPNNVHKYERFLHPDVQSVATCIAPVDFTQSPAIFFKPSATEKTGIELIGHGSFMNADHTRILAKRAILTGHPFRFHKNVITVRYMFFNPEDVEWFKSIPLFTKSGRSGFIKESLGTHGYFKANFDTKLSAQDVVAMSLYKRMWPRASEPWFGQA
ncbi:small subunit rRNA maturation protein TSR1 KNAG_0B06060 [Huiozyma naganishii CBS 8797]|uniref:Bms1-type G domain-containing protein n=1 Tax=Huiozyma naganishii (strain ATCC MYA-139 / BCRC 22969 / CBS 8797 / KCTC 17520 / NBRC 10181 / NCYC 3082 / Yp74L-3) TaxID=1071383 RepID=J7S5B1_HUIN7|nr:hypothetical protein KNAG_0B06060 [Kazachstania naganishii CBS 8797]CCK69036.1 hypothetical protein KNAG_0B06060 [Kazachstania naganishii CBS 8797]